MISPLQVFGYAVSLARNSLTPPPLACYFSLLSGLHSESSSRRPFLIQIQVGCPSDLLSQPITHPMVNHIISYFNAWLSDYFSVNSGDAAEAIFVLFTALFQELHTGTGRQSKKYFLNEPTNEYITPPSSPQKIVTRRNERIVPQFLKAGIVL